MTTCARAFEIDLADFVLESEREEFDSFRDHYPTCADCAAEVRAWTELELRLRAGADGHPAPAELLQLQDAPARLPAARRAALERHVAACRSCRDELGALEGFALPAIDTVVRPGRLAEVVGRLRSLALHPAFAYALVLALAYPAIRPLLRAPGPAPLPSSERQLSQELEQAPTEFAADTAPAPTEQEPAKAVEPKRNAPATAPGVGRAQLKSPSQPESELREERDAPVAALARSSSQGRAAQKSESASRARSDRAASAESPGPLRQRATLEGFSDDERGGAVQLTPVGDGVRVSVPLSAAAMEDTAEVRVFDVGREREIAEQRARREGDRVAITIPASWLVPGAYRVEVRLVEGSVERVFQYAFVR